MKSQGRQQHDPARSLLLPASYGARPRLSRRDGSSGAGSVAGAPTKALDPLRRGGESPIRHQGSKRHAGISRGTFTSYLQIPPPPQDHMRTAADAIPPKPLVSDFSMRVDLNGKGMVPEEYSHFWCKILISKINILVENLMARFVAQYRNCSDGSSVARAILFRFQIIPNRHKWLKVVLWDSAAPVVPGCARRVR